MKKLLGIVVLGLLWGNTTFAEKITFPCIHFSGEPFHTFIIDMDKKIVDNEFKFLLKTHYNKGSRGNRVKIARFIRPEGAKGLLEREVHLYEFYLEEKLAFVYIKKKMSAGQARQVKGNGTAEDFFWTTEEEYHAAGKKAIHLDCDGDSTN